MANEPPPQKYVIAGVLITVALGAGMTECADRQMKKSQLERKMKQQEHFLKQDVQVSDAVQKDTTYFNYDFATNTYTLI